MINLDELTSMTVTELADLALKLDDHNSFWLVTGYISGKLLPKKHPAIEGLWNAAHGDPPDEIAAYQKARQICQGLKDGEDLGAR